MLTVIDAFFCSFTAKTPRDWFKAPLVLLHPEGSRKLAKTFWAMPCPLLTTDALTCIPVLFWETTEGASSNALIKKGLEEVETTVIGTLTEEGTDSPPALVSLALILKLITLEPSVVGVVTFICTISVLEPLFVLYRVKGKLWLKTTDMLWS